jgi:hypothetical protein
VRVCPFCKCDPFHYVDNGIGMEAVAVTCCDLGVGLYSRDKTANRYVNRVLRWMRSPSPRAKARAIRALRDACVRPEKLTRRTP